MAGPLAAEPTGQPHKTEGVVADVQLLDVSPLGAEATMLVLLLEDGRGFLIEGERNLAASSGMQVSLSYVPADDGDVAVACQVQVTAVPLLIEGEERLQPAQRPFTVYSNPSESCPAP